MLRPDGTNVKHTLVQTAGPVVSEVCTGGYGAGGFRDSSARGAEWLVGCSAAGAGVRVGEETLLERVENRPAIRLFYDRCASTTALA